MLGIAEVLGQGRQRAAGVGIAHQQHVTGVARVFHHALRADALTQLMQQPGVDAGRDLQTPGGVHALRWVSKTGERLPCEFAVNPPPHTILPVDENPPFLLPLQGIAR